METIAAILVLAIVPFIAGFVFGFGVRARISSSRRSRSVRYRTTSPIGAEHRFMSSDFADSAEHDGIEHTGPRLVPLHVDEDPEEQKKASTSRLPRQ